MSEPSWELLGGGGVLGPAGIDYIGVWDPAIAYQPGQIVRYNGVDYLACNPSTGQTPPVVMPPSAVAYGTSLPASPADGQEAILVDLVTNPTYQWRFRYNAQSTSGFKWEFIGGFPITLLGGNSSNLVATAPTDLASGPSFTVPRNGSYTVTAALFMQNASGFTAAYEVRAMVYNGVNPLGQTIVFVATATFSGGEVSRSYSPVASAGNVINIKVWNGVAVVGSNFVAAQLTVIPRRVS